MTLGAVLAVCGAVTARAHAQETVVASLTPPKPETADEVVVPTCKTDIRLSGAVYDAAHPERSFALIQAKKGDRAGLVRVGSWLGAYELLAIEPRGILLHNADGECWLRLVGDPAAARARKAAPPPRRAKKPKKASKHKKPKKKKSEVVVIGHR